MQYLINHQFADVFNLELSSVLVQYLGTSDIFLNLSMLNYN